MKKISIALALLAQIVLISCGGGKNNTGISGKDFSLQRQGELEIFFSQNSKEFEEVRTLRGSNFAVTIRNLKEEALRAKIKEEEAKILDIQKNNEQSVSIIQLDITHEMVLPSFNSHQVAPNAVALTYKNNDDYSRSVVFCTLNENDNWTLLPPTLSYTISFADLSNEENEINHKLKMEICQKIAYQKLEFKNEEIKYLSDTDFLDKLTRSKIELNPMEKDDILKQRKEKNFSSFNRYRLQKLKTTLKYSNIIKFENRDIEMHFKSLKKDHQLTNGQYEVIDMKKILAKTEAKEDIQHIQIIKKERVIPECSHKRISNEGGGNERDIPCPTPYYNYVDVGPNIITQYREVNYFPVDLTNIEKLQITEALFGNQDITDMMFLNIDAIQNFSVLTATKEDYTKRVITREQNGSISNLEESKIQLELNPYYSIKLRKFYDQSNLKESRLEVLF